MLRIRPEQLAALSQADVERFEEWATAHLMKFFPQQCGRMDAQQLRDLIRYGVRRSAAYGVTSKQDVCRYIDLMVALGRDYDKDDRLPWAREILQRTSNPGPKIQSLHRRAIAHLRH